MHVAKAKLERMCRELDDLIDDANTAENAHGHRADMTLGNALRQALQPLREWSAANSQEPVDKPILGIVVEGGLVSEIISDEPEIFAGFRIVVIDRDGESVGDGTSLAEWNITQANKKDLKALQAA